MNRLINSFLLTITSVVATPVIAGEIEQKQIEELRLELESLKQQIALQTNQKTFTDPSNSIQPPTKPEKASGVGFTNNGAEVNLYGFIRADAAYQIEGGEGIFNRISKVALNGDANKKSTEDRFDTTLTTTRIGLDFKTPINDLNIAGKLEMDFRGGDKNDTIRLRHVYMTLDNWLIGQTTSSFLSFETAPEILDFNTALGGGTTRTPMLRYNKKINRDTQYFVGLEKGNDENRLPAATVKLSHKFAEGAGLLTSRALIQEVRLRSEDDETKLGWGVGLGVKYNPSNSLIVSADYSHVSGDNKFLLATDNKRYIKKDDDISLIDFDAFQLGATYKFNPKLRSTIGYGAVFYDENNETENDSLQQGWLNLMYNPTKPITFGLEYIYGERETVDNRSGKDNRIEIMAKYDF